MMKMTSKAASALLVAALGLGGCQSSRISGIDTAGPAPLPAAPTGVVQQSNLTDYAILKLADAPPVHDIHFLNSGAYMGGIGEPGVPPAAPALANALFAVTGKRIRNLPILTQAKV